LKKADDCALNPDAGELAFLISKRWLDKYEKYICYNKFEFGFN